ncbi:hypothetical protein CYMTET_31761 [Cymbomonas tetramitiformis]|uniref:Uncharacterized protein n=1 Tax=Cymbomonas tetramitiformis TaxID=36881 RepID=A0AAE0KSJ7_9CHLO|nr:hypothetical protein CYMTET_31761 [Cymbomonas tetramitiformis]
MKQRADSKQKEHEQRCEEPGEPEVVDSTEEDPWAMEMMQLQEEAQELLQIGVGHEEQEGAPQQQEEEEVQDEECIQEMVQQQQEAQDEQHVLLEMAQQQRDTQTEQHGIMVGGWRQNSRTKIMTAADETPEERVDYQQGPTGNRGKEDEGLSAEPVECPDKSMRMERTYARHMYS